MNRGDAETQSLVINKCGVSSYFDVDSRLPKNLCVSASLRFILLVLAFTSCSVPNLETPACTESRGVVKEFYSFHFGNEMKFSQENLGLREKFLTPEFAGSLKNLQSENDIFTTNSTDIPRAFRTGECEAVSPDKTIFNVLLFWRDDVRSEQREIIVETIKQNDKWLISGVIN